VNFPVSGSQLSFGCGIVASLTEVLASTDILNVVPGHRGGCACLLAFLRTRPAMLHAANAIVEHTSGCKQRAGEHHGGQQPDAGTGAATGAAAQAGAEAEAAEVEEQAEAGAAAAAAAAAEAAAAAAEAEAGEAAEAQEAQAEHNHNNSEGNSQRKNKKQKRKKKKQQKQEKKTNNLRTMAGGMTCANLVPAWQAAAAAQDQSQWSEADRREHAWQLIQGNANIQTAASRRGQQFLRGVSSEAQLRTLVGLENADPQALVDNLGSVSAGYTCAAAARSGAASLGLGEDPAGPDDQFDMSDRQQSKKAYLHADVPAAEYCERLGRAACGEGAWMDCTGEFDCKGCAARRVFRSASAASMECLVCELEQLVRGLARPCFLGLQMENALFRLWSQVGCVSSAAVVFLL
jgi:hypothetical protein